MNTSALNTPEPAAAPRNWMPVSELTPAHSGKWRRVLLPDKTVTRAVFSYPRCFDYALSDAENDELWREWNPETGDYAPLPVQPTHFDPAPPQD